VTGPEHYREAERLLEQAARWERTTVNDDDPGAYGSIDSARRAAQAHATLAGVAATIESIAARGPGDASQAWIEAVQ
jgi:acetyl-CoA carboxylase alpha subunit